MKRTKETHYKHQEVYIEREEISGARNFGGEDLDFESRQKANKQMQKQWIEEQIAEKQQRCQQEKDEENNYARQTLELNRMKGMLEDDFHAKKNKIINSVKEQNLLLAQEKRDKENAMKNNNLNEEKDEVRHTLHRGQKLDFTN